MTLTQLQQRTGVHSVRLLKGTTSNFVIQLYTGEYYTYNTTYGFRQIPAHIGYKMATTPIHS